MIYATELMLGCIDVINLSLLPSWDKNIFNSGQPERQTKLVDLGNLYKTSQTFHASKGV